MFEFVSMVPFDNSTCKLAPLAGLYLMGIVKPENSGIILVMQCQRIAERFFMTTVIGTIFRTFGMG